MRITPLITSTSNAPAYNPGMAETFSWIPLSATDRAMFAKAVYVVNSPNQNGIVITNNTTAVYGNFDSIKMITATTFTALSVENSTVVVASVTYPAGFVLEGPIRGYQISTGSVVATKAAL